MTKQIKKMVALLMFPWIVAAQNGLSININDENVELKGWRAINALGGYESSTTYLVGGALLHTKNDNLATLSFEGINTLQGAPFIDVGIGLKAVIAQDYLALPFSIGANYHLPPSFFNDATIGFLWAYAPSALSFDDAKSYSEMRFEGSIEVVEKISLTLGYRTIDTDYRHANIRFDKGWYAGMRFAF